MSLTAERRFELSAIPDGTLHADPDRLAQALRNLARNAIEHTSAPDGLVRLDVARIAGDRVRFVVADDGPGIAADQRERVFDRFHRTDAARDRASGGTGLGLAIVRAIALAHAGRVVSRRAAGRRRAGRRSSFRASPRLGAASKTLSSPSRPPDDAPPTPTSSARAGRAAAGRDPDRGADRECRERSSPRAAGSPPAGRRPFHLGTPPRPVAVRLRARRTGTLSAALEDAATAALGQGRVVLLGGLDARHLHGGHHGTRPRLAGHQRDRHRRATARTPARRPGRCAGRGRVRVRRRAGRILRSHPPLRTRQRSRVPRGTSTTARLRRRGDHAREHRVHRRRLQRRTSARHDPRVAARGRADDRRPSPRWASLCGRRGNRLAGDHRRWLDRSGRLDEAHASRAILSFDPSTGRVTQIGSLPTRSLTPPPRASPARST